MNQEVETMAFLCHPTKIEIPSLLKTSIKWAKDNNINVKLTKRFAKSLNMPELSSSKEEISRDSDMIIVLGGDGSMLEAARSFSSDSVPIAGINIGHLGFLTLDEPKNAIKTLNKLKDGKYDIEKRMMLQAIVRRNGKPVFRAIALNDIVVQKSNMLRVIDLDVSVSKKKIRSYYGDGLIFSTPTGSTAYNISVGGPIIPPWINVITISPLNCHSLNARPVVIGDQETITAKLKCIYSKADLVMDGQEGFPLRDDDVIEISKAKEVANIVVLKHRRFFRTLSKKMRWG